MREGPASTPPAIASGPSGAARSAAPRGHRRDHVVAVPLALLFHPDPDPTEQHPAARADLDGYVVTPDRTITLAATTDSPEGLSMLDAVWRTIRAKGIARRRFVLLDDRGRTVVVMTFLPQVSAATLRLTRSALVVPVHATAGSAEVHLLANSQELAEIEHRLASEGADASPPSTVVVPPARETEGLGPEDWAFLGLLGAVGAFDVPDGPTPRLLAELFGLDPEAFARQALAVERGMRSLVTELFAPAEAA